MKAQNRPIGAGDAAEPSADSAAIANAPVPTITDAIVWHSAGSVLSVMVTPRSGISSTTGVEAGALRVRLAAPPVAGAANKALVRFLADLAKVPVSRVRIVAGASGRRKRVLFARVTIKELAARLESIA